MNYAQASIKLLSIVFIISDVSLRPNFGISGKDNPAVERFDKAFFNICRTRRCNFFIIILDWKLAENFHICRIYNFNFFAHLFILSVSFQKSFLPLKEKYES